MIPLSEKLGLKLTNLWKSILELHDQKKYQKALKKCGELLDLKPNQPDTLAIRELIRSRVPKTAESAYEIIVKLTGKYPNNANCWFVRASIERTSLKFEEAIYGFEKAVSLQKSHDSALSDLANLSIYLRNYPQFLSVSRQLLSLHSSQYRAWIRFVIANTMLKKYKVAESALLELLKTFPLTKKYFISELHLFRSYLLELSGDYIKSLSSLVDDQISDKTSMAETRARLFMKLNQTERAQQEYQWLFESNPNRLFYLAGLAHTCGIILPKDGPEADFPQHVKDAPTTPLSDEKIKSFFNPLLKQHPNSLMLKRILIDLYPSLSESFIPSCKQFLTTFIVKGIPGSSIYQDLLSFYAPRTGETMQKDKVLIFQKLVFDAIEEIKTSGTVFTHKVRSKDNSLITCYGFLVLHFQATGSVQSQKFIENLLSIVHSQEKSLDHANSYHIYSRLLAGRGDFGASTRAIDHAASLDLDDRSINTSTTEQWLIQACDYKRAHDVVHLFIGSVKGGRVNNKLFPLQALWWTNAQIHCWKQVENFGKILRTTHDVFRHFTVMNSGHYPYHPHSLVRGNISTYYKVIQHQSKLLQHPYYTTALYMFADVCLSLLYSGEDFYAHQLSVAQNEKKSNETEKSSTESSVSTEETPEESEETEDNGEANELKANETPEKPKTFDDGSSSTSQLDSLSSATDVYDKQHNEDPFGIILLEDSIENHSSNCIDRLNNVLKLDATLSTPLRYLTQIQCAKKSFLASIKSLTKLSLLISPISQVSKLSPLEKKDYLYKLGDFIVARTVVAQYANAKPFGIQSKTPTNPLESTLVGSKHWNTLSPSPCPFQNFADGLPKAFATRVESIQKMIAPKLAPRFVDTKDLNPLQVVDLALENVCNHFDWKSSEKLLVGFTYFLDCIIQSWIMCCTTKQLQTRINSLVTNSLKSCPPSNDIASEKDICLNRVGLGQIFRMVLKYSIQCQLDTVEIMNSGSIQFPDSYHFNSSISSASDSLPPLYDCVFRDKTEERPDAPGPLHPDAET